MSSSSVPLRQHTKEEWEEVRPVIERLYVQELRPLSTVVQIMGSSHQFKASVAMYKRRLRDWGVRKNRESRKSRAQPLAITGTNQTTSAPRYLSQNDVDEALHTLLDLLVPWITHAGLPQYRDTRVFCPARAAYIYDDFACLIAAGAAEFESGDVESGGAVIRQAFLGLEHTLTPEFRSMFTLHSLLFALAILNSARLFEISRLLIAYATQLVISRTRADIPVHYSSAVQHRLQVEIGEAGRRIAYDGKKVEHPFPQIMSQLQILRAKSDDAILSEAVLRAWSAYYYNVRAAVTDALVTHRSQKAYWKLAVGTHRCPTFTSPGAASWNQSVQPVLHYLDKISDEARNRTDNEIGNLCQDEIVSIYSFARDARFEEKALGRVEKAGKNPEGWNASLELAVYYQRKGDMETAVTCLARVVPDSMGDEWKGALIEVVREWMQDNLVWEGTSGR